MTLHELYFEIRTQLTAFSESEAAQIVMAAMSEGDPIDHSLSHLEFFSNLGGVATPLIQERARFFAAERLGGRPLQHILGFQEFLGHRYWVSADVLIPRPETEALTHELIQKLKKTSPKTGIEVGLGSGAITISLLMELPHLKIYASECSDRAMDLALRNLENQARLESGIKLRFELLKSENALSVQGPFSRLPDRSIDFIISNPPYLLDESETTEEVSKYEPQLALFAPEKEPFFYYREIALMAKRLLVPGGLLAFEVPHERANEIVSLLQSDGFRDIEVWKDLTGRDRGVFAYG